MGGLNIINKINNIFDDVEVVEPIGNYGDIICRSVTKSFIDDEVNIQKYSMMVYNVLLKNGNLGYIDSLDGTHITPIVFPHVQPFF